MVDANLYSVIGVSPNATTRSWSLMPYVFVSLNLINA